MSSQSPDDSQVRALVLQSERALAAGQRTDAQRLLDQARALAPAHPLVLNAAGVQELHRGNTEAGQALIQSAIDKDPANPAFWINLASALRRLSKREEEMNALQRALAIEPRHLLALLQKGSLLDLMGQPRAAASTYHSALQTIPPGARLPPTLREPLQRAEQAVRDNNALLEAFVTERLQAANARHSHADRSRFEHCLDALLEKRRIYASQPTFIHFPKLPAEEFYPREHFEWLASFEEATGEIRAELEGVLAAEADKLEPYIAYPEGLPLDQWTELNHSRKWSVYYLWRDGRPVADHLARCPKTAALLAKVPRIDIQNIGPTAFFSILDARSHIPAHTGVTNTRLITHVPLIVPPGCRFRVGADTREWQPGHAWVFDDTIEHEAWNDSDVPRAVLIFDIWNPYLTEAERDLVRATVEAVTQYYGKDSPLAGAH